SSLERALEQVQPHAVAGVGWGYQSVQYGLIGGGSSKRVVALLAIPLDNAEEITGAPDALEDTRLATPSPPLDSLKLLTDERQDTCQAPRIDLQSRDYEQRHASAASGAFTGARIARTSTRPLRPKSQRPRGPWVVRDPTRSGLPCSR